MKFCKGRNEGIVTPNAQLPTPKKIPAPPMASWGTELRAANRKLGFGTWDLGFGSYFMSAGRQSHFVFAKFFRIKAFQPLLESVIIRGLGREVDGLGIL